MPGIFRHQIGFGHIRSNDRLLVASLVTAVMYKIIIGIHILQQMALFQITHTSGRTVLIQFMRQRISTLIQGIVITGFIDAHTPKDNGGMIAILQDHLFHIFDHLFFPFRIPDILPARDLGKHQQAQLVTAADKML